MLFFTFGVKNYIFAKLSVVFNEMCIQKCEKCQN